jgi:hypothetical protein
MLSISQAHFSFTITILTLCTDTSWDAPGIKKDS